MTTTAQLIPLAEGGYLVDTPGIRQFQLWDDPGRSGWLLRPAPLSASVAFRIAPTHTKPIVRSKMPWPTTNSTLDATKAISA